MEVGYNVVRDSQRHTQRDGRIRFYFRLDLCRSRRGFEAIGILELARVLILQNREWHVTGHNDSILTSYMSRAT